jgi:hypothetical protein
MGVFMTLGFLRFSMLLNTGATLPGGAVYRYNKGYVSLR